MNFALLSLKSQIITSELFPFCPDASRCPWFDTARHVIWSSCSRRNVCFVWSYRLHTTTQPPAM